MKATLRALLAFVVALSMVLTLAVPAPAVTQTDQTTSTSSETTKSDKTAKKKRKRTDPASKADVADKNVDEPETEPDEEAEGDGKEEEEATTDSTSQPASDDEETTQPPQEEEEQEEEPADEVAAEPEGAAAEVAAATADAAERLSEQAAEEAARSKAVEERDAEAQAALAASASDATNAGKETAQAKQTQDQGLETQASLHVAYRTHVQTHGWQGWKRDGTMSGTQHESKRLEGICIKLEGAPCDGSIEYRTHVQTYGWQGWKRDGAMSGTQGESKRLEAIQIRLTGTMQNRYDVWYRVHAQNYGWLGWARNGSRAGTATYGKRLEGIEIRLLPKGSNAPGSTQRPYVTRLVKYQTHVQTFGWQGWVFDGNASGTSGQSKRLEGIHILLPDPDCSGGIEYRTHVQTFGWQGWKRDGTMSGTQGESKRLEAIQIRLYGQAAERYDVWYRVHAQTFGWMGWTNNGQQAGTAAYSKRLEAIQIVLTSKGSAAPATNFKGAVQTTSQPFRQGTPSSSSSAGKATSRGPASAGSLRVKGNQLVDKSGEAIQLTGVSTHGLAWFPGYVNNACFSQLRKQWNANVVRLAMYTEEYGGYCSGGDQRALRDLVKKGVRLATDNDLYVIVDWHILSDGNPNRHVSEAKSFFADISSTFKNNVNVIYEICNEPNGGTSWSEIKRYANQVIPVIRKNDADAVVIVGTPTWSQEVDKAAASPLSFGNTMYALHFYAATHRDDLRNRMVSAVKGGLPVFVSEFGICDASGNGAIDQGSANSWITTMKSLGVSWCMWSLCNKAESASVIKSSCSATSGFRSGDLATSGSWLLKALNGTLPAGTDSSANTPASSGGGSGGSSSGAATAKPVTFTVGNLSCKATLSNSWGTGDGKTCYQYELSITNKGAACTSWNVSVPFNKAISYVNGWNGTYSVQGSKLVIRNASYNGSIAKGATISGIGFQVTAASGLAVKP